MEKETEISNKTKNTAQETSIVQDIVQLLLKIAFIVLVVFLIFTFLYGIVRINDVSHETGDQRRRSGHVLPVGQKVHIRRCGGI